MKKKSKKLKNSHLTDLCKHADFYDLKEGVVEGWCKYCALNLSEV